MTSTALFCLLGVGTPGVLLLAGCSAISIAPACPNELTVGESATVWANEENPGAIPTYLWEAVPADAGTFDDPSAPITTFQAAKEGRVKLRLTASDGLYQVISECQTTVIAAPADTGDENAGTGDGTDGTAPDNANDGAADDRSDNGVRRPPRTGRRDIVSDLP